MPKHTPMKRQTSDHAQTGPGLGGHMKTEVGPRHTNDTPTGIGEAGNARSGTSQGSNRGKDGHSR